MGITNVCTPASFTSVSSPQPVYVHKTPPEVLHEWGQPSGLSVTITPNEMAEVVVPNDRNVYWRESSLTGTSNLLHLYGARVRFVVQWESTSVTYSTLNSTHVVVIGREDTALWFKVTPSSLTGEESTATLDSELSVENVVAVNGVEGLSLIHI